MATSLVHKNVTFKIGDSIQVNYLIKEKDKQRIQAFDGIVLAINGTTENKNFIVQKNSSDGVKVERIFPINSPWIDSIKKLRTPKSRIHHAKLYFLRHPQARAL
jgi:large subunit ribosomal protein L19